MLALLVDVTVSDEKQRKSNAIECSLRFLVAFQALSRSAMEPIRNV